MPCYLCIGNSLELAFCFHVGSSLELALPLYLAVLTSMPSCYVWLYRTRTTCFGSPLDSTIPYLGSSYELAPLCSSLELAGLVGNPSGLALPLFGSSHELAFFLW